MNMNTNTNHDPFKNVAHGILTHILKVGSQEKVLLIFDDSTARIAKAFTEAAADSAISLTPIEIRKTGQPGADPDPETVAMISQFSVVLAPTYYSLTHCASFSRARAAGIRGATLPGITDELFLNCLVDPQKLKQDGCRLADRMQGEHEIRILSDAGTDLSFHIGKIPFSYDTGEFLPGKIGNIPFGEGYTAPDPETMNGILAVDGSIGCFDDWHPGIEPAVIRLENGVAVEFQGARAKAFESVLRPVGASAFVAAEFGIGTNPGMALTGNLLGDEKIKGTIHIAFGNNRSFGGSNLSSIHIDNMILKPTLLVDGSTLIEQGIWRF